MATASNISLDFADHGFETTVPDDDIARLMYYLHSVTVGVGIDILPDDLIRYKHYYELTPDRIALVLQFAIELNPEEYIGKFLFRDDEHEVIEPGVTNKFVTISAACDVVSFSRDVVVAGRAQNITKVMFFTTTWLDTYYIKPAQRIGRLLMGTAHCSHCEGKAGICKCSSCDRPEESECTPFANFFLGALTGTIPAPAPPPPEPEIVLRPDQHYATCDGCTWGGLTGARFKCGECDDYDLCEPCYRRNVHDMWHAFVRIDTPGATPIALISRAEAARIQPAPTPPAVPRLPPALPPRRVPTPPPVTPPRPPALPPRRVPTPPRVAPVPPPPPPPPVVVAPPAPVNPPPPPPPYDPSGGDGRDDPAPSAPPSGSFFYETMSTTDLHGFLKERGVAHDDISEKDQEGLCKRVWETHCDCMSIAELNGFLAEQNISTADCRDINSRRQKAKDAFRPPPPPAPPVVVQTSDSSTSKDTGIARFKKDDEVVLKNLTRVEMNGKTATVLSVDHAAGKVQIKVHDLEKTFKVKPENISLAADLELEEEDEELE